MTGIIELIEKHSNLGTYKRNKKLENVFDLNDVVPDLRPEEFSSELAKLHFFTNSKIEEEERQTFSTANNSSTVV